MKDVPDGTEIISTHSLTRRLTDIYFKECEGEILFQLTASQGG